MKGNWVDVAPGCCVENNGHRATIQWKHIDGPMLIMRSGELHWLTLGERFLCWIGRADAESLEYKHRPNLRALFGDRSVTPRHETEGGK